jgi:hypothetical protein
MWALVNGSGVADGDSDRRDMSLQRWSAISRGTIQKQIIRSRNLNRTNHPKHIRHNTNNWYDQKGLPLTAIVFSLGCQLACKIFLLKSSVSSCIASLSPACRAPFLAPGFTPGNGPPIFLALKADLSACSTTSPSVSESYIRK